MTVGAVVVSAISLAAQPQAFAAPQPKPDPQAKTLEEVRGELKDLYDQAEVATEAYKTAKEKERRQRRRATALSKQASQVSGRLGSLRQQAGAAARAQYRGGGLPPEAQLMLGANPQRALDNASLAEQAAEGTKTLMATLKSTKSELQRKSTDASDELEKLNRSLKEKQKSKQSIEEHISKARKLETSLNQKELRRIAALDKQDASKAQQEWLDSGALKGVDAKVSSAGKRAVEYAAQQLGKPYVWGAEGPSSFDCSGLTSQAWAAAGTPIPRTSQEQWRQLTHVGTREMRPGDLIIYFSGATHVGMYVGQGNIIHAPRPGRTVTVAPAASMQILGVVRPDA